MTPRLHILAPTKLVSRKRRWGWWVLPLVLLGLTACPTHMGGQRPDGSFARQLPTDSLASAPRGPGRTSGDRRHPTDHSHLPRFSSPGIMADHTS